MRRSLQSPDVSFFSLMQRSSSLSLFFFFNDTATTEIYTLSLHDALPILSRQQSIDDVLLSVIVPAYNEATTIEATVRDRKSTRLNSSHSQISYAVFCLKKKNTALHADEHRTTRSGSRIVERTRGMSA